MLLAINVNNTHTLVGLYEGATLTVHWRLRTDPARTVDEWVVVLRGVFAEGGNPRPAVRGIVLGSVVPPMNERIEELCRRLFGQEPLVVGPGVRTGVPILYDNPKEVGADRIADAVAAFERYGGPTIVIDFGTATTFEVVSARGEYLGGIIVPGIEISLEALSARAALLPRVELVEPRSVLAKNTVESVQAGVIYGFAAQVDGLCRRLQDEVGPCNVVATGGLAGLIGPYSAAIQHHEPWLTLDGLRIIFGRNER